MFNDCIPISDQLHELGNLVPQVRTVGAYVDAVLLAMDPPQISFSDGALLPPSDRRQADDLLLVYLDEVEVREKVLC